MMDGCLFGANICGTPWCWAAYCCGPCSAYYTRYGFNGKTLWLRYNPMASYTGTEFLTIVWRDSFAVKAMPTAVVSRRESVMRRNVLSCAFALRVPVALAFRCHFLGYT